LDHGGHRGDERELTADDAEENRKGIHHKGNKENRLPWIGVDFPITT
jgi:hypothetical protein